MTKRRLYAQLVIALTGLGPLVTGASAQEVRRDAPCGACLMVTIDASQAVLLPDDLAGLTVLVRGGRGPEPAVIEGLGHIARKGGRGGIAVIRQEATLVSLDTVAFELKQSLTEYRARVGPAAVMAVFVPAAVKQPLIDHGLRAYADVIPGVAPDVSAALELTRTTSSEVALTAPPDSTAASAFFTELVRVATALPRGLAPVPGGSIECAGSRGDIYLNPQTQRAIAVVRCQADLRIQPSTGFAVAERTALSGGAVLVMLETSAGERFAQDVQVTANRRLSVEEIIARHQAVVRRQESLVRTLISTGSLTLTFEAPGFPAPVTIDSQTIIYRDSGRTELEQRAIRVNGIEFRGGSVPRLPILEPERVASPPLTITLTDRYRYRLNADDEINGTRCYVVAFEPAKAESSFRGRAWIAMDGFALLRISAAQTGLRGPITSSEQVDEFRGHGDGIWLLARSDVYQIYNGAGHHTPIHRRLSLDEHQINPPDFVARREAAYASTSVMLRDTPAGYRYLKRTARRDDPGPVSVDVARSASHVRTLAGGVIIDPNISVPLPFAGVSYVDFDLFGSGTQLNVFFGGTYGQLAFSVPSLFKTRWQLAGRAFGIATAYNDRSFRDGLEIYEEGVRQRPAHASVWLLRPLTTLISVRAGYDLDYTRLRAAPETALDFVVPADQVVHAARVVLEAHRAGWTASFWWNPARRSGWRPWGHGTDYEIRHDDFQRYGVTMSKSSVWTPQVVTRVEGQWMDGRDLDRFSRYSFGTFDNRLRGYPAALVRYDRGGVLRTALAWSAAKVIRLEGFADIAAVHDPGFGRGLRSYSGIGAAAEAPAPFGLLAAVEWGYGFNGVRTNGETGTHVVRVSFYKVF